MTNVFKNFGMAMVAILMIVGFSAFKVVEKPLNNTSIKLEYWYFNGNLGEETDASKYSKIQDPNLECGGNTTICLIQAPEGTNPNFPDLNHVVNPSEPDKTVESYITEAMDDLTNPDYTVVFSFRNI